MQLFNPKKYQRQHADARSRELVLKTIDFFEKKGLKKIKADDQAMVWYEDFLQFIKEEQIFADLLTPEAYSQTGGRWDMWRISEFNEVLGFYGLCYWYAWQVTILGLGPIWMGDQRGGEKEDRRTPGGRRDFCLRTLGTGPRRRPLFERDAPHPAGGRQLSGPRFEILYRQRQLCRPGLDLRQDRRQRRVCLFCRRSASTKNTSA